VEVSNRGLDRIITINRPGWNYIFWFKW